MGSVAPESGLRRLYAATLPSAGVLELGAEAAQHARVLRLAVGDAVQLFDGRGASVDCTIAAIGKASVQCAPITAVRFVAQSERVVLIQCLPKAGKLDDIVRMTAELGVAEIALAVSEFCVAKAAREEQKVERLERIAIEATRQSEQAYVPLIRAPRPLAEVLASVPPHAYRAAFVERTQSVLPETFATQEVWLVIGPEGGLSLRDREALAQANFISSALGRSILRTETAAVVGVALTMERLRRGHHLP